MTEPSQSWNRQAWAKSQHAVSIRWWCLEKPLEKPCFELVAKGVFRLGRCYILWQGIPGLWASNREIMATGGW